MAKRKTKSNELSASDYEPLLVAISSRAVDTCLQGARCLALLEDPRAFGLLMQLSREENPDVRLETCRSLAQLADRRATDRLCTLLVDPEVKVRDAAFTALSKICTDDPLVAAENGLAASFEDIRRRGLEVLVRVAKKSKKANEDVHRLLRQALNDPAESIRNEAFKFALNSKFDGGDEKTLRFLLGSSHADVRREVLNETMAEENQEWAQTLILELLSDPNKGVRSDAFSFLKQKYEKKTTIDWLSAAIASDHVDIRKSACQSLIKNGTDPALDILAAAIHDDDEDIRQLVLKSLIQQGSTDALVACLDSQHVGIRLSAAMRNRVQSSRAIGLKMSTTRWRG